MSASSQVTNSEKCHFRCFSDLMFSDCCVGMAMSQVQRLAAPLQRSRGGSASPPNPKSSPAAPLHSLECRSPPSGPHLKSALKPKIQPQATSRRPAAKRMFRDLCRQGTGGPLGKTNRPSPNPNPLSFIQIVLNLRHLLTQRT